MSAVLDDLRREQRQRMAHTTAAQRLTLSQELGERGLRMLMASRGIDRGAAMAIVRASRRSGRKPSSCLDDAR